MKHCSITIVSVCFNYACLNANSPIGHNIAVLRNKYNIDIVHNNLKRCISKIRSRSLSSDQLIIMKELRTLLSVRAGEIYINGFSLADVTALIKCLTT